MEFGEWIFGYAKFVDLSQMITRAETDSSNQSHIPLKALETDSMCLCRSDRDLGIA